MRRPIVAGNWKMNGLSSSIAELDLLMKGYSPELAARTDLMLCPPFTLIEEFAAAAAGNKILIGAQDCHPKPSGAHTGDISAEMLADSGASAVIVGHSERRAAYGESDELVRAKAEAALRAGLMAVICVGETLGEREKGQTLDVVGRQIKGSVPDAAKADTVIAAYEPVWAIGTGNTPTIADIAEVHGLIRREVATRLGDQTAQAMRILYGGSVKADNAKELLRAPDVDGALVGGASLRAKDFLAIAEAYLTF
jgi:triosephosphate isomerase